MSVLPEFPMPRCRRPWRRKSLLPRLERQGSADPHGLLPHLQALLLRAQGDRLGAGPTARRQGLLRPQAPPRGLPAPGRRGRPRVYGEGRIVPAERAVQRRGWTTGVFDLYGKRAVKRYQTFVATWKPAGGAIRVVLVDEPGGWVAFFCTDVPASAAEILATVADRFALETAFRDCKEVVGAGRQQV